MSPEVSGHVWTDSSCLLGRTPQLCDPEWCRANNRHNRINGFFRIAPSVFFSMIPSGLAVSGGKVYRSFHA